MKDSYPSVNLERLCWLLGLSRQAFYKNAWSAKSKESKEHLVVSEVRQLRSEHPVMGARKLHLLLQPFLQRHSIKMGRDDLFSTLDRYKLLVKRKRRRVPTTQSHHWLKKHPNRIQNWYPQKPEELWVADITYVPCGRNHLYLSLITDAYSHKIMGYHIADTLETVHCITALKMAVSQRNHRVHKLLHHSDRGIQYCSSEYIKLMKENNIEISMTQSGDPLENPIAERINGIIKNEYLLHYKLSNLEDVRNLLRKIINRYNEKRPHQSIQRKTPIIVHEQQLLINRRWGKQKRSLTLSNY